MALADRQADDGAFSREVIDLAMMAPRLPLLRKALTKAVPRQRLRALRTRL